MDTGGNFWGDPFLFEEIPNSSKPDAENLQKIPGSLMYPRRAQNYPGVRSGVILNETSGSTVHASQSPNTSSASVFKRSVSCLSETERAARKRIWDQEYRKRVKNSNLQMKLDLENLTGENDALKKENRSLKEDNASMKQNLTHQEKSIDQLRNEQLQLKSENDKTKVLSETLSKLVADPLRLENQRLKNENALLRKNANLNSKVTQLLEENAKLKTENKVLKFQNDALYGKIVSDNEEKHEHEP